MASSKSYEAFTTVDELVSKPVLGSDGAASWQEFRKGTKECNRESVAPALQVKRSDRLGTGLSSLADERAHETRIRQESGGAALGSGYTNFKRKNDSEDASERKRRKNIEKKIRPEKKAYFIFAESFKGWKFDYVFTTRDRGTGYYWDGSDSLKKMQGKLHMSQLEGKEAPQQAEAVGSEVKEKRKRGRKTGDGRIKDNIKISGHSSTTVNVHDQVEEAIRRRNERLRRPPSFSNNSLIASWRSAVDKTSGKTYYFNPKTGERQWDPPTLDDALPEGWKSAKDLNGQVYFYNTINGKTSWERPNALNKL